MTAATLEAIRQDMEDFDRLPPALRRAVRQSLHKPRATPLLQSWRSLLYQGASPSALQRDFTRLMQQREMQLLAQFAAAFERRHKIPYPHVAAGASVLYSEDMPTH